MADKSIFETLFDIDVSEYTDERKGLTYLSWSHALSETMKRYPDMSYSIRRFGPDELPYQYDETLGYMVSTTVTINGVTKEMWLPVLDTNNKAMKKEPYTYDTKSQKGIRVEAATYYDINKALMRSLVKNLAAFGLGLYIYNKDDLPEVVTKEDEEAAQKLAAIIKEISAAGSEKIKDGVTKDDVYATVAKLNGGESNPSKIDDIETANAVLAALKALKPAKKTTTTKKSKEETA